MATRTLTLSLPDTDATQDLARRLAPVLAAGDCLLLTGPIGAGKTFLARAVIQARQAALGMAEDVPSPTYTLVQTYEAGGVEIWHADLYRLTDPAEVIELGLDEAFDTGISLIEWPDRLGDLAPPGALRLELSVTGDTARRLDITGDATWHARLAPMLATLDA
ncbi:tRNA (adenosine(37)-N6)-threonylcarbamoyltransferase complex ATPase subunit type 1 TsaE [Anianabacter salinae]|uniref:tRNA (adenosine(37)-N6)-threonylcarbamoyltransferase complex ATPase subunit type 1 TsaE n=1 Tax=Anianabacter salinae TaxID=2851023 RepID=UPI00225DDC55|nr:tRNA (adenosine(37)-N6)-threonylcarbamoyltransferase complex ATPase subunit type 1 TsaE [Anianabacter salinae]MBV0913493.1 tRNA (adenosine(37)-N6)-threonylcarbamoyltransferase complex ATPase subunit type 1 TsaE [Anianabacter salinae]